METDQNHMKTPSAIILAIGMIAGSVMLSKGLERVASAINNVGSAMRSSGSNYMRGDFNVKVNGNDREPLSVRQMNK